MDWINLHTSFLDSPDFLGAEPVDRATWLCLLRYCVGQENSGTIADAASWGDRKWQQLVRVTLKEVNRNSDLWKWVNDDLVVTAYPAEAESTVIRNRENGKLGGRPKKPTDNHPVNPDDNHPVPPRRNERVREGKGKDKEKEGEPTPPPTPPAPEQPQRGDLNSINPPCPVPARKKDLGTAEAWWLDQAESRQSLISNAIHISQDNADSWRRDLGLIREMIAAYGLDKVIYRAKQLVYNGAPPYASKVLQALKDKK